MLFNRKARERIDELERRLRIAMEEKEKVETALETMIAASEQLQTRAFLVDISRSGRENTWTLVRNGEFTQIKQMGLLSDDIAAWKRKLVE